MSPQLLGQALLLFVPDHLLVPLMSISSLVCLGMAIGKVHARKTSHERKAASALAHAIRDRLV